MGSEAGRTGAIAPAEGELLETWCSEPCPENDGDALHHALSMTAILLPGAEESAASEAAEPPPSEAESCRAALGLLMALFRAERAFLFEVTRPGPAGTEPTVGVCIASRDADGEPVNQPERKVPLDLLLRVGQTGFPAPGSSLDSPAPAGEGRGEGSVWRSLALPVEGGGALRGALFIENRFQALDASRRTLRLALAYSRVLGSFLELRRLREENAAIWNDLERFRERKAVSSSVATPPAGKLSSRPREGARRAKRSDLKGDYSLIIGSSPRMIEIFQLLDRISGSNAPILINGESGTGKELVAHAVHESSPRKGKVFVSENCGALTETLLESELFGYDKGAFTGANKDHKGLFELAVGGTLFLDEVGDMSPGMQKKLLRVLQEAVIRRVGGKDYIPVDVRIISATNKDLIEEVRAGNFREDLYYRLNVINLKLPPLRDRKEDIPELVEHFLVELALETGIEKKIEPAALQRLIQYGWPGNIRELRNEIKRFYALSDGDIRVQDLSEEIIAGPSRDFPFHDLERQLSQLTLKDATERLEKEMIRNALVQSRGNKSLVAKMLQVPKTSLYNKINKYGLDKI